jgi:pimeloyl-ACP methyl ester carboxylesterase
VKESCCQFGPREVLAGVLSEPDQPTSRAVVVLVSAGVTPKFGPFRLYAELARRLAGDGFRTLRFDLGGIGDSGEAFDEHPLGQRTQLQIGAALDYLTRRLGPSRFILAGLCSGAEDSFRHAERDERVTGVVMIDPFAYRTPGFLWRHLGDRAKQRVLRALRLYRPLPRTGGGTLVNYEYIPARESTRILRVLLGRRVRLSFIYTGGMRRSFNHPGQLRAMFRGIDFGDLLRLDHFPKLDHTQLLAGDRHTLVDAIARRISE